MDLNLQNITSTTEKRKDGQSIFMSFTTTSPTRVNEAEA